jgi:hypothetical protein
MARDGWRSIVVAFLMVGLVMLACGPPGTTATSPTAEVSVASSPRPGGRCGDGMCEGPENAQNCPQDCVAETVTSTETEGVAVPLVSSETPPPGYITLNINVHDFVHVDESGDTLLRLIDLFEKHGVRGDFYLTAPMVHFYEEQRPDVVERLRASDMTISYHMRPPHPLYEGFDQRFGGLDQASLITALRDYETYRLDLATGDLLRDEPGGYRYVTDVFGRAPVVVSVLNPRWRSAALPIFAELGAQMTVIYHEAGADLQEPFEWMEGLLIRPSDFSITRWAIPKKPGESFWWTMLDTEFADQYVPAVRLQSELAGWHAQRPPFITVLIHENNFYRRSATPWALVYYHDAAKTQPRTAPFDLSAPDASQPRTVENQEAIWEAYEDIVAYAAEHLQVVTSEDIVELALEGQY